MDTVKNLETSFIPQIMDPQTLNMSAYERSRLERIKANLERMHKLGITHLSLELKSLTSPPKRSPKKTPSSAAKRSSSMAVLQPSESPRRRSSRLQNLTPVSYSEAVMAKKSGPLEGEELILEEGSKPEVYTEQDEKLLGSTERSWTLYVDGYGKDGKRIYDPVRGKTCHQCRQKTLGCRTHCSQCQMVQGQFCGDCLYTRYGEHVLEAIENPNWICPVCRGICNCSLCRHGKGWAPTGFLYKKIASLGYKSVAHYLIQTQRAPSTEEKNSQTVKQASAKRSLPFSEMETPTVRSVEIKNEQVVSMPQYENTIHDESRTDEEKPLPNSTIFASGENELESKVEAEKKVQESDNMCTKLRRKRELVFESSPESIKARLRSRQQKINGEGNSVCTDMNEESHEVKQPAKNMLTDREVKGENKTCMIDDKHVNNSIAVTENSPTLKKKTGCDTEPNADSIGGRLRRSSSMSKED